VEHAAEARVLDGDAVARAQPRSEHALDAVERAAHDRERRGREAVGREPLARELEELGAVRRAVVEVRGPERARDALERRREIGSKAGSGLPDARSRPRAGSGGAPATGTGGAKLTRVPRRPSATSTPRRWSAR